MIIYATSSEYLINYDDVENFIVFVVCDDASKIKYGSKISEIFSRTFCNEVYNNRYITNLKNLIEVGIYEAIKNIKEFLNQKKIDNEELNISVSGGVYKNGKLMLFSLGNTPIFVIDKNYYLHCPFELNKDFNLLDWRKFVKFSDLINNPKSLMACSNKFNGKLFKLKIEDNKIIAEPFKYKIVGIINRLISLRDKEKIEEYIKNILNLNEHFPLFVVSFDEEPIDDNLIKLGKPKKQQKDKKIYKKNIKMKIKPKHKKEDEIFKKTKTLKTFILLTALILVIIMGGLIIYNTSHNSQNVVYEDNSTNNTNNSVIVTFNAFENKSKKLDSPNISKPIVKLPIVNNKVNIISNKNTTKNTIANNKNKDDLKILVKIGVDKLLNGVNYVPLSINFPENGDYYISITSKDDNLRLINIENGNIIYKNSTSIELFEEIENREKLYNLNVEYTGQKSDLKDLINIEISKIEILEDKQ